MNLKESYRYANFLNDLLEQAYMMLENVDFVTTVEQRHFRSKTVKEAEDEILVGKKPFDTSFSPMEVVDFVIEALAEKEALSKVIADAKADTPFNIDNAITMNKKKQQFIKVLNTMADMKTSVRNTMGKGYRFNVNNEQVPYLYDIQEIITIDFDRSAIKKLVKKYHRETDEISARLDSIEILTEVGFRPRWDINDSLDDILCEVHEKKTLDAIPQNEISSVFPV